MTRTIKHTRDIWDEYWKARWNKEKEKSSERETRYRTVSQNGR